MCVCVNANNWEGLKIQKSTKENKANTCVPAETSFVLQPLDGRDACMTTNIASTRLCLHTCEHTCLAHTTKHVTRHGCVFTVALKGTCTPVIGRWKDWNGAWSREERSWAKARGVAAACLPCACLPRVSRPAPGLPPAALLTPCFCLVRQGRLPHHQEPMRKAPGLGLPDPISGVSGCETSWPLLLAPLPPIPSSSLEAAGSPGSW